ncbi:MAG: C1 family peptidase, partial [Candidatus Zixiibacteriota bacterium]
ITTGEITNQEASGRCWMFAASNMLRPKIMDKLKLGTFKMSTNYLFFWDKLEKSNTFLEAMIELTSRPLDDRDVDLLLEDPCGDGGWWSYVVDLIGKYGVVPDQVMPETYATAHTGGLNAVLNRKLRKDASVLRDMFASGKSLADLRSVKNKMLSEIYSILALNFGQPPQKFTWRFESTDSTVAPPKEFTPKQFYSDMIGIKLEDQVVIFDHPGVEYFKYYEMNRSSNLADHNNLRFANLPIDSLKRYALATVLGNDPLYFACDVGKDNYGAKGILAAGIYDYNSVYGFDVNLTKRERILYRDSSPTHAMVFTGVDTLNGIATKWKVENSWGDKGGEKGYWTMYDDWFNEYVYCVIIDRKLLPKEVAAIFETKPTSLPSWDPMWGLIRSIR